MTDKDRNIDMIDAPVSDDGAQNNFLTQKFISTLFHELRLPISSINGYLSLLLSGDMGKLSGPQLKIVQKTRDLSLYTIELINNLSSISQLDERRKTHYDKIEIQELVQRAVNTLSMQIRSRNLKIHTKFSRNLVPIWAVSVNIEQVIVNILSNAVKFTPKGKDIYISARINTISNKLCLTVTDTGIGIPPKALKRIFEDFYRAENVVRQYEGCGLGLSIVKKLLEHNKGTISIKSKVDKGTVVSISLSLLEEKDIFNSELEQYIKEASRLDITFCLIMVVDASGGWNILKSGETIFKDKPGEKEGIGKIILSALRKNDRSYMISDKKYIAILPDADYSEVQMVCERLRSILQEKAFLEMGKRGRHLNFAAAVTFAVFPKDGQTKEKLISYLEEEIRNPNSLINISKR